MADRAQPLKARSGLCAAAFVAALIFGTLAAVALRAEGGSGLSFSDWAALRFTLIQAGLSTLLSVALAVPVARALARRRFVGHRALIAILGAPFILPVIVAILGLLEVFGRTGWISTVLGMMGLPPLQIYGLHGVVLAHVFFNLPLATRFLLQGWQEIPAERFRMAAQLDFDRAAMLRWIEWPMLRAVLPGIMAVVFAICLTSFAVALTLGGGPGATTVELAIYQAFRFDFDLGRAALLAVIQLVLTGAAAFVALRTARAGGFGAGLDRAIQRWDGARRSELATDMLWIGCVVLFLGLPLMAVIVSGLKGIADLPMVVIRSATTSILIAIASTGLMLMLALPMAAIVSINRVGGKVVELVGILGLAASPLVIGTGLFILIYPVADPFVLALPVTAMVNAVMALPFALRILIPRARDVITEQGRLSLILGMAGWPFVLRVLLPRMRGQIGFAAGLTAALSMGDLGVITLFADPDVATLPLQIYRLMGSYQSDAAAAGALLLLILSLGAFWLLDKGGRRNAEA